MREVVFGVVYRQSRLGPVDPSFRALFGRLKFTVRRHKFNKDALRWGGSERITEEDWGLHVVEVGSICRTICCVLDPWSHFAAREMAFTSPVLDEMARVLSSPGLDL